MKTPDGGKLDVSIQTWATMSNRASIKLCRELMGLEPIKEAPGTCLKCKQQFPSEFKGRKQTIFICTPCSNREGDGYLK